MFGNLILVLGAFAVSALCVFLMIRKADRLGLIQAPVARSSHIRPTPTGGGVGIVIAALLAGLLLPGSGWLSILLLLLGFLIAILGLVDDWRPLSARLRLPVQALVAALAVWATDATVILLPDDAGLLSLLAGLFLAVAGVWWINLFNFMDGIDGIAGQQAMLMMLSAMTLCAVASPEATGSWLWWMMACVAAATAGFLVFNWPPARIFMGDAGSTFLGYIIFALALASLVAEWITLPQWLLLAALFAVDATITLVVRVLRGQNPAEAHRSHAYQRLSRRFGGARPVSTGAAFINIAILLPLALLIPDGWVAWCVTLVTYLVLAIAALAAGAGLPDQEKATFARYRGLLGRRDR